jgi:RNA-directed DNA polymerase
VQANIFKINGAKTHVRNRHSRQEITGIKINAGLNVRQQLLRQVRAMLHAWETFGEHMAQAEFRKSYDRKQRNNKEPKFRAVLRGKIEFIGFIRGRDDALYLRLLMRLLSLDAKMKARPVVPTASTKDKVLEQAVWLLISDDGNAQATAFSAEGLGLLTAFHAVEHVARGAIMYATRPGYDEHRYPITVSKFDEVRDVAQLSLSVNSYVELKIGTADQLQVGHPITLLGFPRYNVGDGVHIHRGPVTQNKVYNKVPHFVIDPVIFRGNSGGPVLDARNRVIGIAVKGYERPGGFSEKDELSSFVPIDLIKHLKPV